MVQAGARCTLGGEWPRCGDPALPAGTAGRDEMRICWLDQDAWEPGEVVLTLDKQADGSVRATWHDENFRRWFAEGLAPAVLGDDGELVRVNTPELLYRYAAKVYGRSQTIVVIP